MDRVFRGRRSNHLVHLHLANLALGDGELPEFPFTIAYDANDSHLMQLMLMQAPALAQKMAKSLPARFVLALALHGFAYAEEDSRDERVCGLAFLRRIWGQVATGLVELCERTAELEGGVRECETDDDLDVGDKLHSFFTEKHGLATLAPAGRAAAKAARALMPRLIAASQTPVKRAFAALVVKQKVDLAPKKIAALLAAVESATSFADGNKPLSAVESLRQAGRLDEALRLFRAIVAKPCEETTLADVGLNVAAGLTNEGRH